MKSIKNLTLTFLLIAICLGAKAQTITITSDASWLVRDASVLQPTWVTTGYSDAGWVSSVAYDYAHGNGGSSCYMGAIPVGSSVMWADNSLSTAVFGVGDNKDSSVYFRKHFTLVSPPATFTTATASICVNDKATLYINGTRVGGVYASGLITYPLDSIRPKLVCGDNLIAIDAKNVIDPCWWVYFTMTLSGSTFCGTGPSTLTCNTENFLPKVTSYSALTCSQIFDNGTKVGIGTTAPGARLDIRRPLTSTDAGSTTGLNVTNLDVATGFFPGANAILGTCTSAGFSAVGVGGTASLAAWNVGVSGNATVNTNASSNYGVMGAAGGASSANYGIYGTVTSNGAPANCAGYFNGDVYTTNTYSSSDEKLKTNAQDFKDALSRIKLLQPKSYVFKTEEYKDVMNLPQGNQIGIMAQNLQTVFPNLVKEKIASAPTDPANGKKVQDVKFLAVNYVGLVPVLVQAVKELSSDLDQTKKENADLRNMINDLCSSGCAALKGANTTEPAAVGNQLLQNVPNPFANETTIGYVLNTGTTASMNINALDGKMVKQIPLTVKGQGAVTISGSEFGAGTYTYTLYVDGKVIDTKLMVISATK